MIEKKNHMKLRKKNNLINIVKEYFKNEEKWSSVILELKMDLWDKTKKNFNKSKENLMNSFLLDSKEKDGKLKELIRNWKVGQRDYDTSLYLQGMNHIYGERDRTEFYFKSLNELEKYIKTK